MKAEIFWVDKPIAVLARPRGGDWLADEVNSWREQGINVVVSLLTEGEEGELDLDQERTLCEAAGLHYYSFPINDRSVPASMEDTFDLIVQLTTLMIRDSKKVGIHCRQGLGRSPLIAAAILVWLGHSSDEALQKVGLARGVEVPETAYQIEWLSQFAAEFGCEP